MPLIEHLLELRTRLSIALGALIVGGVLGYIWWSVGPFGTENLGDLMTDPYCDLPADVRLTNADGQCQLLQTGPFDAFNTRLKVGFAAGAVLTAPIWFSQIWGFITPGLYAGEKKFARIFVSIASLLFAGGAVLAYLVVPKALTFLTDVGDEQFFTAMTAKEYIAFVLTLMLVFGVSFELPLLVVMLNRVGVLPYQRLRSWQRGIIFGLFVFAAVATPGQDPISMLSLATALVLLFEIAVLISFVHDRRKGVIGQEELDPDEPSKLHLDRREYGEAT